MNGLTNHLSVQQNALMGAGVATILASALVAPQVTDLAFWALLAGSVLLRFWSRGPALQWSDLGFICALSAWPAVMVSLELVHGPLMSAIDRPVRLLLAVPLFLIFRSQALDLRWIAGGSLVGLSLGLLTYPLNPFITPEGLPRAQSFAGNPISYGQLMLVLGLIGGLCWLHAPRSRRVQWVSALCLIMGIAGAYFSGTRGVLVTVPALLLGFVILTGYQRATLVLVFGAAVGLGLAWFMAPSIAQRFHDLLPMLMGQDLGTVTLAEETSAGHRLRLWSIGVDLFEGSPWIGVGADQLRQTLLGLGAAGLLEAGRVHLHNEWVHTLASYGLLGMLGLSATLLGLLGLFAWSWAPLRQRAAGRSSGSHLVGLQAGLGVLLVAALSGFSITDSLISNMNRVQLYTVLLAVCAGSARHAAMAQAIERSESQDSQAGHCQA